MQFTTQKEDLLNSLMKNATSSNGVWRSGIDDARYPVVMHNGKDYQLGDANSINLINKANVKGFKCERWISYDDIKNAGIWIKKGERGTCVTSIRADKSEKRVYYFNAEQLVINKDHEFLAKPVDFRNNRMLDELVRYSGIEIVETQDNEASYDRSSNIISMPARARFNSAANYYVTLLHEIAHAASENIRTTSLDMNDPDAISKEELTAELTAYILSSKNKISYRCLTNSTNYISTWLQDYESAEERNLVLSECYDRALDNIEYLRGKCLDNQVSNLDEYTLEKNDIEYLEINSKKDIVELKQLGAKFDDNHLPYITNDMDKEIFSKFRKSKIIADEQDSINITENSTSDVRAAIAAVGADNSNSPNVVEIKPTLEPAFAGFFSAVGVDNLYLKTRIREDEKIRELAYVDCAVLVGENETEANLIVAKTYLIAKDNLNRSNLFNQILVNIAQSGQRLSDWQFSQLDVAVSKAFDGHSRGIKTITTSDKFFVENTDTFTDSSNVVNLFRENEYDESRRNNTADSSIIVESKADQPGERSSDNVESIKSNRDTDLSSVLQQSEGSRVETITEVGNERRDRRNNTRRTSGFEQHAQEKNVSDTDLEMPSVNDESEMGKSRASIGSRDDGNNGAQTPRQIRRRNRRNGADALARRYGVHFSKSTKLRESSIISRTTLDRIDDSGRTSRSGSGEESGSILRTSERDDRLSELSRRERSVDVHASSSESVENEQSGLSGIFEPTNSVGEVERSRVHSSVKELQETEQVGERQTELFSEDKSNFDSQFINGEEDRGLSGTSGNSSESDVRELFARDNELEGVSSEKSSSGMESILQQREIDSRRTYLQGSDSSRLNKDVLSGVAVDFVITDNNLGVGTINEKFRRNVEAVKVLKQLENEQRFATPEEQETLSKYVGWGGLSNAFDPRKEDWSAEYKELKDLLTDDEYRKASMSTVTAFYTQPEISKSIFKALKNFKNGSMLEPSCGTGNFFGAMPNGLFSKIDKKGVELDSISGRIASFLYPSTEINIVDFVKYNPLEKFDVVVGNVPFSNMRVNDPSYKDVVVNDENGTRKVKFNLHNYFLTKALELTKAGGVVAVVTSSSTLDGNDDSVRRYLASMGDFLGAVRLPNNAFVSAGTSVVSDIIFLQKRENLRYNVADQQWIHTTPSIIDDDVNINSYFATSPEMILGTQAVTTDQFGDKVITVNPIDDNLQQRLDDALNSIDANIHITEKEVEETDNIILPYGVIQRENIGSFISYNTDLLYVESDTVASKAALSAAEKKRVERFIELAQTYDEVIDLQLANCSDDELKAAQAKMKDQYDSFTLANTKNPRLINSKGYKSLLSVDSRYNKLCALEILDDNKNLKGLSDLFFKRTISPQKPKKFESSKDALNASLLTGKVDFELMESLLNFSKTKDQILDELQTSLFKDPADETNEAFSGWVAADEYLSGDVVEKLALAKNAAKIDTAYNRNVEALEAVQPKRLELNDIDFNIGSTFIPERVIKSYISNRFGGMVQVEKNGVGGWEIQKARGYTSHEQYDFSESFTSLVGGKELNVKELLDHALNQKKFEFKIKEISGAKETIDQEKSDIANAKIQELENDFKNYILSYESPEESQLLEDKYNRLFNSVVLREFDGSNLEFLGKTNKINLYPHQQNAVARCLFGGNTLLAHEVGAGKTNEIIAAAMEGKRLGFHNKSLVAVPKAVYEQWANEIQNLYPNAKVLTLDVKKINKDNREKTMSRIAVGDYDIILATHEQLLKMPLSIEFIDNFINEKLEKIEEFKLRNPKAKFKEIEKVVNRWQIYLEKIKKNKDSSTLVFEKLGIDKIFVDEAHSFKNLATLTAHTDTKGIGREGSDKSINLLAICTYLNRKYGDKRVVFATGTPVSNNLSEFHTMCEYLSPQLLRTTELEFMDDFLSNFGKIEAKDEIKPEGGGYHIVERLTKFKNVPEMMKIFQVVADIKTIDQLPYIKLPNSKIHVVSCPASTEQSSGIEVIQQRATRIRNRAVRPEEDNMLMITNDGRKLAIDARLVDSSSAFDPHGKLALCIANVKKIYDADQNSKDTQIIFSDIGTPGGSTFDVYNDIKSKLIDEGVPEEEIAIIHDFSDKQKKDLFEKVNNGEIRVLIGSTQKLGTGVNVQKNLKAVHHIDVPWRPSDMTQRNGRLVRQGNIHKDVDIFQYVTENSFETIMYDKLLTKHKFTQQLMHSQDLIDRTLDTINDDTTLSYEEAIAASAGDRRIIDKITIIRNLKKYEALKKSNDSRVKTLTNKFNKLLPESIKNAENYIKALEEVQSTIGSFPLTKIEEKGKTVVIDHQVSDRNHNLSNEEIETMMKHGINCADGEARWHSTPDFVEIYGYNYRGMRLRIKADNTPVGRRYTIMLSKYTVAGDVGFIFKMPLNSKPSNWINTLDKSFDSDLAEKMINTKESLEDYKVQKETLGKVISELGEFDYEQDLVESQKLNHDLDVCFDSYTKDEFDSLTTDYPTYQEWLLLKNDNAYIKNVVEENLQNGKMKIDINNIVDDEKLYRRDRISHTELKRSTTKLDISSSEVEEAKQAGVVFDTKNHEFNIDTSIPSKSSDDVNIRYYVKNLDYKNVVPESAALWDPKERSWFIIASVKNMKPILDWIDKQSDRAERKTKLEKELNDQGLSIKLKRSVFEKAAGIFKRKANDKAAYAKKDKFFDFAKFITKKGGKVDESLNIKKQDLSNLKPLTKIYLNVDFSEKDKAKALGAKWDVKAKNWYITDKQDRTQFAKWDKPKAEKQTSNSKVLESTEDAINEMLKDMRENGMIISRNELVFDGASAIGRCRCDGDHDGEKAGWYSIHLDGCPVLTMTNHRNGGETRSKPYPTKESLARRNMRSDATKQIITQLNQKEATHEMKESLNKQVKNFDVEAMHNKISKQKAQKNANASAYLSSKGLSNTDDTDVFMMSSGNKLYTCAGFTNIKGQFTTKQYIDESGQKRFETGGQKSGSFHVVGGYDLLSKSNHPIFIAEGLATAITVSKAIEEAGVAISAGDCGNLEHVAKVLRDKFPKREIIIASDNDHTREDKNVGLEEAIKASKAINAKVIYPQFEKSEKGTDFNDLMVSKGLIAVKQSIATQLQKLKLNTKKSHSR